MERIKASELKEGYIVKKEQNSKTQLEITAILKCPSLEISYIEFEPNNYCNEFLKVKASLKENDIFYLISKEPEYNKRMKHLLNQIKKLK